MWRASGSLSVLALAGQVLQLALQFVLARSFGTGAEIDALVAASAGPNLLLALLILSVGQLLVPQLLREREAGVEAYATARNSLFVPIGVLGALLATGFALFPEAALGIFTPGLEGEAHALARGYLLWTGAGLIPSVLLAYLTQTHNARENYARSALVGMIQSLVLLTLFLAFKDRYGVFALVMLQVLVGLAATLVLLGSELRASVGGFDLAHPSLRKFYAMGIPVVIVAASTRVNVAVDRFFVSFLPEGSLSLLHYADRWVSVVQAILSMPLVTVLFTRLSKEAAAGDTSNDASREGFAAVFFIGIPAAIWTWAAAPDLATFLLYGRARGPEELTILTNALRAYSALIACMAFGSVLVKSFYAQQRTISPMLWAGLSPMILNVIFDWLLVERYGVVGLAAVTSINAVVGLPLGAWLFARNNPGLFGREFWTGFARAALAGLPLLALPLAAGVLLAGEGQGAIGGRLFAMALAAPVLYLLISRLLGSPQASEILQLFRRQRA